MGHLQNSRGNLSVLLSVYGARTWSLARDHETRPEAEMKIILINIPGMTAHEVYKFMRFKTSDFRIYETNNRLSFRVGTEAPSMPL